MIVKRLHTTLNLLAKDPLLGGRNKAGTLRVKLSESSDFLFGLPCLHHHQVKGIPPRINIQWKKYQANILPLLSSLVRRIAGKLLLAKSLAQPVSRMFL